MISEALGGLSEPPMLLELRTSLARLEVALSSIRDSLVITNDQGLVIWCNQPFERLINRSRMNILGRFILPLLPLDYQGKPFLEASFLADDEVINGSTTMLLHSQPLEAYEIEWRRVATEVPPSIIFCFRDISSLLSYEELIATAKQIEQQRQRSDELNQELKQHQLILANLVKMCPVTGLPNRLGMQELLNLNLKLLSERGGVLGILFCDLDHFKDVNDVHGHQIGDELLIEISRRLQESLPPEASVSRLGGDEFVVLTGPIQNSDEALSIAHKLEQRVGEPLLLHGQPFTPSMSVGIALTNNPAADGEELLRQADVAMYQAKRNPNESIALHDEAIEERFLSNCRVHQELRLAIRHQNLSLAYQPIVCLQANYAADDRTKGFAILRGKRVVGHEALVRLHPKQGLPIDSQDLVIEAERTGLVIELGSWVIKQALVQLQHHPGRQDDWNLAINISPLQLEQTGFAADLLHQIEAMDINPQQLVIELTENRNFKELNHGIEELVCLRDHGVRIHLDDFGTGFASLSWLARLPIDGIKIDRSFIKVLGQDNRIECMVRSMIRMGLDLGLDVVAEGIETEQQQFALEAMGCNLGQGHLFARPGPLSLSPIF